MIEKGVSLIEILIVIAILAVVSAAIYKLTGVTTRETSVTRTEATAHDELEILLSDVRRHFQLRIAGAGSVKGLNAAAFNATGVTPCQDIQIDEVDAKTNTTISVQFLTRCRADTHPNKPDAPLVHPDIQCSQNQRSEVVFIQNGVESKTYPGTEQGISMALCSRLRPASADIEAGSVSYSGDKARHVSKRIVLSFSDRGQGIQYLSPQ